MRRKNTKAPLVDMTLLEREAYRRGWNSVAGIDEVGRGPLAGPVVAAAVVLPREVSLPGVTDSKLLTPAKRESCYREIAATAVSIGIGVVEASEIDRINILQATFRAMIIALDRLETSVDHVLIDGPYTLPVPVSQQGVPGGDRLSLSIAAASIVAKVHRDRLMCDYHRLYPQYDFESNKGYGTRSHLEALLRHGPCPLHRTSFKGVLAPNLG